MADKNTLIIEVDLDASKVKGDLDKFQKKADKTGTKIGKSFEKGMSSVKSKTLALAGTAAAMGAAYLTALAGRQVIDAAARQQVAVNKLETALKTAGSFSVSASKDFQKFASQLQKTSTIGDETTLEMLGFAKSLGLTNQQAKEIVSASADMSKALGIEMRSAVVNTAKTLSGMKGELGELVPSLRNLTAEQLKAGDGIKLLRKQFAGSAAGELNTFSGATESLGNVWADFQEQIGNVIVKSPAVLKVIGYLKEGVLGLIDSIEKMSSGDLIGSMIVNLAEFGGALNTFVVLPLELTFNAVKVVFNGIMTFINSAVATVGDALGAIADVGQFLGFESEMLVAFQTFRDSSKEVLDDTVESTQKSYKKLFDFKAADSIDGVVEKLKGLGTVSKETSKVMSKSMTDIDKKIGDTSKSISINMNQVMANGIANAAMSIGNALANGENAFDAFGAAVLNVIGDVAISVGKQMIAMGVALEALRFGFAALSGLGAIAAGVALVLVGSLMKSASGNLSGAATSAANSSLGGGGSAPAPSYASTGPTLAAAAAQPAEQEPDIPQASDLIPQVEGTLVDDEGPGDLFEAGPQVIVNVDTLVEDDSGSKIVELINQAFDTQGTVINKRAIA